MFYFYCYGITNLRKKLKHKQYLVHARYLKDTKVNIKTSNREKKLQFRLMHKLTTSWRTVSKTLFCLYIHG